MHYRSPEAVLQAGYGCGLDVWAAGCLAAELGLGAQVIGRTEASTRPDGANHVTVIKDGQALAYA